jgi:ribose transport system permease protein
MTSNSTNVAATGGAVPPKSTQKVALLASLGMLPVLVVLYIGFFGAMYLHDPGVASNFISESNTINILQQVSINMVLAIGMTFVILTGGIDLSVGAMLAFSAVVGMIVATPGAVAGSLLNTLPPSLALAAFLGSGLLMGLLNGTIIAFLDFSPFITTLATMTTIRGLAYLVVNGSNVLNTDITFGWIGNGVMQTLFDRQTGFDIPWLVVIAAIVAVASWFILRRTVLGGHIYAVGGNAQAARLTGINVSLVLVFSYAVCGIFSGLAGAMTAARLLSANGNLGVGYELDAIAAVVLGGTRLIGGVGSVLGTVIGALIIGVMSNGLTILGVSSFWQYVVKGLVILAAVFLDRMRQRRG